MLYGDYEDGECKRCGKYSYNYFIRRWCKSCLINDLRKNFTNWTSGNEKIDSLIQGKQLEIDEYDNIIVEWILYDKFDDIKELGKDEFSTIYSAIWKDGPLKYDEVECEYSRKQCTEVNLKLYNSQNITNEFLNGANNNELKIYGISQNSDTKDYILVLQNVYCNKCGKKFTNGYSKWCKTCQLNTLEKNFTNWTSGNEKIDSLIQGKQLEIDEFYDIIVEWIPYDKFDDIKELRKDEFSTIYSAIWKDGPLQYDDDEREYSGIQNKKVNLKSYNSQNINAILNEVNNNELKMYGISQNPYTKNYIISFPNRLYCNKCGKILDNDYKWCKPCQINEISLTSKIEKIDNLIREMRSKINSYDDIVFEWIPYDKFDDIKEIGKGGFAKVYSAIWVDGPLLYNIGTQKYTRNQDKKVALKCLYNSQNITSEFLNEAKLYSIKEHETYSENKILKIYGISQNPDTKEYIIVLDYAEGGNFNYWMNKNYNNFKWSEKLVILYNISLGLKEIHQKKMVHRDFHAGNILLNTIDSNTDDNSIYISDMGLCGDVSNIDQNNIYGVIPYVAPEVLKGQLFTQAADVYSLGMIMYFVATGKQPFADCAHDEFLVLNICNGNRPEVNMPEAPKCYIDLMKQCWNSNPDNRPKATEIFESIKLFIGCYNTANFKSYMGIEKEQQHYEMEKQFKEAEEYRKLHLTSFDENKRLVNHPQAIYASRLLNPFTKNIPKYDNIDSNTVEIIDFTKL